ncbi:MAG: hypothetical protein R3250_17320, partial [Melioribacteraceae bacterium]|nr:hypothetical protein [Melioribacteraceae bacterium]
DSAERFAIENGYQKVFVETTSWQARPFYEKLGYMHLATLKDRPKGHASHYLTKELGNVDLKINQKMGQTKKFKTESDE